MAKEYKILKDISSYSAENQINSLAEEGWVVKSFNVVFKGEENDEESCFVLMEYDDDSENTYADYSESIYDVLGTISEKLSSIRNSLGSGSNSGILDKLSDIQQTLQYIEGNTSQ